MLTLCGGSSRIASANVNTNAERLSDAVHPTDWIKLLRPKTCRLVAETEQAILLYHNYDNGMHWHAEEPQSVEYPVVRVYCMHIVMKHCRVA